MKVWNYIPDSGGGLIDSWGSYLSKLEQSGKVFFPDFSATDTLFIFSDYSGDHSQSKFFAYSFLISDADSVGVFSHSQKKFWEDNSLGDRIINYKNLKDNIRAKALVPFLKFSNDLNGILFSVIIPKRLQQLFMVTPGSKTENILLAWNKAQTKEKLLRLIHFITILLNGLSKPHQNIFWITDNDDIVANDLQLTAGTNLFANLSSQYLYHDLGHFRFGRKGNESSAKELSKLCSIPDLASGALTELLNHYSKLNLSLVQNIIIPFPLDVKRKVLPITYWHSYELENSKLRKIVINIKEEANSDLIFMEAIKFHELKNYLESPF